MTRKLIYFLSVVLTTVLFCSAHAAHAERIPADEVEIITPAYSPEPENFKPRFGTYRYAVNWQGIPAGSLEILLEKRGANYRIEASARTNRFIDFFYKLRFTTNAIVSATSLYPQVSVYNSRENHRNKKTTIEFLPDGEIKSVRVDRHGDLEKLTFKPNNFTLDPFSAVFLALSLSWEVGDTRQFDTFTGKSRYLVELTAIEKTTIDINGTNREAIVISPRVDNLTKKNLSEEDEKLREARIYVSTDKTSEILRITSDIFIGTVNTNLVSFSPSENKGSPLSDK